MAVFATRKALSTGATTDLFTQPALTAGLRITVGLEGDFWNI